jgi:chromosome segregation ATPase
VKAEEIINIKNLDAVNINSLEDFQNQKKNAFIVKGVKGYVYDLIPLKNDQVKPIIHYYLSDVIIIENKSVLDELTKFEKFVAVTLTGEIYDSIGTINAGRFRKEWLNMNIVHQSKK